MVIYKDVLKKPEFDKNGRGGLMLVLKDKNGNIKESFTRTRIKGVGVKTNIEKKNEVKK